MENGHKNLKISTTAYRVLYLLYLLNQQDYVLDELIEKLSNNEVVSRTFSKDVIIKYINTLRISGFDIVRSVENVQAYHLQKAPFRIELKEEEIQSLAMIYNYVKTLHQPHLISYFESSLTKIERFLEDSTLEKLNHYREETKAIAKDNYKKFANIIKILESYCIDKQNIAVTYSPLKGIVQKIILEPEKIEYRNRKVYICGHNPMIGQMQHLQLDYINHIKQLPSKSKTNNYNYNVTFRLSGKLAKSYRPYEREEVIETKSFPPSILVTTDVGDINSLLHRLMKYGQYCEVISPSSVRNQMITIINDVITRYKKEPDIQPDA